MCVIFVTKFIFLAHAVIYRKGGFPVAFGAEYDNINFVEDIKLEPEQQLYAKNMKIKRFLFTIFTFLQDTNFDFFCTSLCT